MDTPIGEESTAVVGLGHIVLCVSDLTQSLRFYRDVFRWPVVMQRDGFPVAGFSAGNTHHDLLLIEVGADASPIPSGRRLGMYHFGVKVGDHDRDLEALLDRLDANPGIGQMVGAADHGLTHSLYLADPDGNEVEAYIDVPGLDWRDPAQLMQPARPLNLAGLRRSRH